MNKKLTKIITVLSLVFVTIGCKKKYTIQEKKIIQIQNSWWKKLLSSCIDDENIDDNSIHNNIDSNSKKLGHDSNSKLLPVPKNYTYKKRFIHKSNKYQHQNMTTKINSAPGSYTKAEFNQKANYEIPGIESYQNYNVELKEKGIMDPIELHNYEIRIIRNNKKEKQYEEVVYMHPYNKQVQELPNMNDYVNDIKEEHREKIKNNMYEKIKINKYYDPMSEEISENKYIDTNIPYQSKKKMYDVKKH